jgi:hypothetical protein
MMLKISKYLWLEIWLVSAPAGHRDSQPTKFELMINLKTAKGLVRASDFCSANGGSYCA